MPNKKLTYEISADTAKAVKSIDKIGQAGKDAGDDLADGLGGGFKDAESAGTKALSALSSKLDNLESEVKGTASAVKAIGGNVGEGFDSSRIEAMVGDLRKMGVTFEEIEAKAKEFADVVQRVDGIKLDAVNSGLTSVGHNLDKVTDGADQSRSVLANMAGNAAQDLGELGGVVGTLGVGIGQLAEYAVDGNINLSNLTRVAGPMATLAGATFLLQSHLADVAATKAWEKEQVEAYADAIDEVGVGVGAISSHLRDAEAITGRVPSSGILGGIIGKEETVDITEKLAELGVTVSEVAGLIADPGPTTSAFWVGAGQSAIETTETLALFGEALLRSGVDAEEVGRIMQVLSQQQQAYRKAVESSAAIHAVFGESAKEAGESLKTVKDGAEEAAAAMETYQTAIEDADHIMSSADFDAAGLAGATSALQDFFDTTVFGARTEMADAEAAYDNVGAALDAATKAGLDFQRSLSVDTPEGRAVQDSLKALSDTLIPDISAAFENSHGDIDKFSTSMTQLATGVMNRLKVQFGLTTDEANELAKQLGLVPENVETTYRLMGEADARAKLELLSGVLDGLPETVQSEVRAAILADDPQAAIDAIQAEVNRSAVRIPTRVDDTGYWKDVNGLISATKQQTAWITVRGRTVGQIASGGPSAGGTSMPLPGEPTAGTMAAPMTTTTSAAPVTFNPAPISVNVNVSAAVIGNQFDVDKVVRRATIRGIRLAGTR